MKRLVLPLLAALALPTAINAQPTYLKCELNENRLASRKGASNNFFIAKSLIFKKTSD